MLNSNRVLILLLLVLDGLVTFSQDSVRQAHSKDSVFVKIDTLKAAIVTAVQRPHINGDTTEYNTRNVQLRPNANVEDLLRQLPGLQIDANGNITYNGERIHRLLVDGEDIFGSDPTLVTRNFGANKIARVQVLDRKDDQVVFTGVDDGARVKTLNLVLKESAKDGYFGKLEAGGNSTGYYNANAVLVGLKHKEQFAALGIAANTGVLGFASSTGGITDGIGLLSVAPDALGASAGAGVPRFAGIGFHYANTMDGTQNHLSGNYQYSLFFTNPVTTTQTVQAIPGDTYQQAQQSTSVNQQGQHWLYGMYDWFPNREEAVQLRIHAISNLGQNELSSAGSTHFNDTLVNSSQRSIHDNVTQENLGADINWRVSPGPPGRSFAIGASVNRINLSTNGYVYSLNKFFSSAGIFASQDTIDQRKEISSHPITLGGSLSYTEPLWKGVILATSYGITFLNDNKLQGTYNRGDGKYRQTVDSLSSQFQSQAITQHGIFNLQGKTKRLSFTIGGDWIAYYYRQKDLMTDSILHQKYMNLAPRVQLNYTPDPATSIRFLYTTSTQQPSITQLQPIKNNNDPLHITLGNPELQPSFNQNFKLDVRRARDWLFTMSVNLSLASNSITMKTFIDTLGKQVSQPVNVDGGRMAMFNFSINRKILGFDAGIHGLGNYTRTLNYINTDLSRNNAYTGGGGFSLSKLAPDKYLLQLNSDFIYFDQTSSVNVGAPVHYWSQNHTGSLTIYFVRNLEINTNAGYTWQEKTSAFSANTSVLIWNFYVSRNFLHDRLAVKAQLNNILNENSGISRTNVNNINTESSTNILGRYWMLSAAYHFDRKFKRK